MNIPYSSEWVTNYVTLNTIGIGKIWIRVTCMDSAPTYIDNVQFSPCKEGYHIVYVDGPQSAPFSESYSDTWLELVNVDFQFEVIIEFTNSYSSLPGIVVNTDTNCDYSVSFTKSGDQFVGCVVNFTGNASDVTVSIIGRL